MPSKTITTGAVEIIPRGTYRKSLVIQNTDTTDTVFIKREHGEGLTVSSTDFDIKLGPGASVALSSTVDGMEAIQSRYTGIASANTPRIAFFETEDIKR
jgi:hypothetical protein